MTELPFYENLNEALEALFGAGTTISGMKRAHGGDQNDARKLTLSDGRQIFMKSNTIGKLSAFVREWIGLAAIADTQTISVPVPLAIGTDMDSGFSFLLMEYLPPARENGDYWEVFAKELAGLHRADPGGLVQNGRFGHIRTDVAEAEYPYPKTFDRWIPFFQECRLGPQIELTAPYFSKKERQKLTYLNDHADEILIEPEQPSLVHGDLWGGNYMTGPDGKAWLIDPLAYVGHPEVDIAMSELFGGFSPRFYNAYKEYGLMAPGYPRRRGLYQLYHLVVHVRLFGEGYVPSVLRIMDNYR